MGALWTDLLLAALLAAILYLLWRLRAAYPLLGPADTEADRGRRLPFGYFPKLARQAGFEPASLRWPYWLSKIALAAILPLVWIDLMGRWGRRPSVLALILLALVGLMLPDLWLLLERRRRQRRIRNTLSYFLDLIVALLHSGLSLEAAFRRAGSEGLEETHPLAEEVNIVARELEAGQDRTVGFQALGDRTGVAELRGVATALRMGTRLGAAAETTLSSQAELLRIKRREAARRAISLAALKTLLPVMLCGFPLFLVIVLFPAIAEIADLFRQMMGIF